MSCAKFRAIRRSSPCLQPCHLYQEHRDTPNRGRYRQILFQIKFPVLLAFCKSEDVPYCFKKCTTLFAKVCLLDGSAAMAPNNGCVTVPLSEKVLRSEER